MITWNDFEKIDIRVGTILTAQPFKKAKQPAYQLSIDFGDRIAFIHGKHKTFGDRATVKKTKTLLE